MWQQIALLVSLFWVQLCCHRGDNFGCNWKLLNNYIYIVQRSYIMRHMFQSSDKKIPSTTTSKKRSSKTLYILYALSLFFVCVIVSGDLSDILLSNGYRISRSTPAIPSDNRRSRVFFVHFFTYLLTDCGFVLEMTSWRERVEFFLSLDFIWSTSIMCWALNHKRMIHKKRNATEKNEILKLQFKPAKWISSRYEGTRQDSLCECTP